MLLDRRESEKIQELRGAQHRTGKEGCTIVRGIKAAHATWNKALLSLHAKCPASPAIFISAANMAPGAPISTLGAKQGSRLLTIYVDKLQHPRSILWGADTISELHDSIIQVPPTCHSNEIRFTINFGHFKDRKGVNLKNTSFNKIMTAIQSHCDFSAAFLVTHVVRRILLLHC